MKYSYRYTEVKMTEKPPLNFLSCTICNLTLPNYDIMKVHMEKVHKETPHLRLERITQIVQSSLVLEPSHTNSYAQSSKQTIVINEKSLDCTECGVLFKTEGQFKTHNE